ncbi:hypothetical protein INP83_12110 [Mucilaginibacter sp. 21P]|uniref:hypothetical protein n=1 Tax=Mucilaginibacter sp. 21P TaxID=2778902 RepID=UPI001C58224A|nr:hypothetical protein [Mucilaginibacter sp. 21P]QXV63849.1 hypothetical protein INP83_12110 [Mucilaginibacter sp. 21P]
MPEQSGDTWSMDFMCDVLVDKWRFCTLNIIDDFILEAIVVEAVYTIPAIWVIQILERTIHEQGKPTAFG